MDGIEVDRDGTRYGPYTPEEFLAYLASGHIAASDRARIGTSGGFEPVPAVAARIAGLSPAAASPAGFWRRAGAYAIDAVILVVGLSAIVWFVSALRLPPPGEAKGGLFQILARIDGLFLLLVCALGWPAYFVLFESSRWQATPGKRVFGIGVTDRDGQAVSFLRALGRHAAALANYATFGLGYLLIALPPEKRGLHDHLAGTRVLCMRASALSPWWAAAIALLLAGTVGLFAGVV